MPRTKTLRRTLGLAQEEFSVRFQIPVVHFVIGSRVVLNPIRLHAHILQSSQVRQKSSLTRLKHGLK